jgi:hypothetical protein
MMGQWAEVKGSPPKRVSEVEKELLEAPYCGRTV